MQIKVSLKLKGTAILIILLVPDAEHSLSEAEKKGGGRVQKPHENWHRDWEIPAVRILVGPLNEYFLYIPVFN